MKTKGPQRYRTANDIRDAIDRYRAKAKKLRERAEAYDLITSQMVRANSQKLSENIAYRRLVADKLREAASRIEERQLTKLKNKLAEILTPQLPSLDDGNRSIPVK